MSETPATVFRFAAEGVDLEFAGSEDFVEKQLSRFQAFLQTAVGGREAAPAPTAATAAAPVAPGAAIVDPTAPKEGLAEFYRKHPVRGGRGAIQDRILLFIYFMQNVQGKRECSGDDILWCHQQAGVSEPKNLHNALGVLKRKVGYLQEGTKRGLYGLSAEGKTYIESRFRG